MRRLFIIIAAAILITGCKVSKEASTVSEVKTEIKTDVSEVANSESKTNTAVNTIVSYNDSEVVAEDIIITEFSQPDTAGKQYVIKTTKIQRSKTKQNKLFKTDTKQQIIDALKSESKTDKSTQKINENTTKESKTITNTKTPGWVYPVSILIVLGLLILVYMLLKRYKIL